MAESERSRQRGNDVAAVGRRVGDQVRRVRSERGWTQADLSRQLRAVGRPIPVASVGRLESGDRRVDVDDLLALAAALDVSPLALLLPFTDAPTAEVDLPGARGRLSAFDAWLWALGVDPLWVSSVGEAAVGELREFRGLSRPWWLQVDASLNLGAMDVRRRWPDPPATGTDHLYGESREG
jgi:transcriptional regulator with XRE-family HTH domain